jgi:hypothetical protein
MPNRRYRAFAMRHRFVAHRTNPFDPLFPLNPLTRDLDAGQATPRLRIGALCRYGSRNVGHHQQQ